MDRPIGAEALKKDIEVWLKSKTDFRTLQEIVDAQPTLNTKEERSERWAWKVNSMGMYGAWCTGCECGWEDRGHDFKRINELVIAHKFCPNCGSRMWEDKEVVE